MKTIIQVSFKSNQQESEANSNASQFCQINGIKDYPLFFPFCGF